MRENAGSDRRPLPFATQMFIWAHSQVIRYLAYPLLYCIGLVNRSMRDQIQGRTLNSGELEKLANLRSNKQNAVVFYCSSAGEYEQARPIINRLHDDPQLMIHCFFFSCSGYRYAQALSEVAPCTYSLAPLDTKENWCRYWQVLNPSVAIVIRHEFWPAFLSNAFQYSTVLLANLSMSQPNLLGRIYNRLVMRFFDECFVVSAEDRTTLVDQQVLDSKRLIVTGDSKYDRAVERLNDRLPQRNALAEVFETTIGNCPRLIIGSAWPEDLRVVLPAFREFKREPRGRTWQVILAPHEVTKDRLQECDSLCRAAQLSVAKFSQLKSVERGGFTEIDVILVDQMGFLAELYGLADLAFIGGGMHHRIHNVLEAASFGLPLAFGPRYHSQKEAVRLVERGLAEVVSDELGCLQWLERLSKGSNRALMRAAVEELQGASDLIARRVFELVATERAD